MIILFIAVGIFSVSLFRDDLIHVKPRTALKFSGEHAYQYVQAQVEFGPRVPGSKPHALLLTWLENELISFGWHVEIQEVIFKGQQIRNLLAYRNEEEPQVIFGAHYDSRPVADRDIVPRSAEPVPGANDGASGVAVLLELARTLPTETVPVWLIFFDAEDSGGIPGWDWALGAEAFIASYNVSPRAVVVVDMVGDADLNIYMEYNSNHYLNDVIWTQAEALGYEQFFIPEVKYSLIDDHSPFLSAGIPAIDIIDFDYPYWHTSSDTADKVSPKSLEVVGNTLWEWLVNQK
jgi:glutaminyl-peptide cyclotransferase